MRFYEKRSGESIEQNYLTPGLYGYKLPRRVPKGLYEPCRRLHRAHPLTSMRRGFEAGDTAIISTRLLINTVEKNCPFDVVMKPDIAKPVYWVL